MRKLLTSLLFASSIMSLSGTVTHGAETYQPQAVIELFTSQGCHSCPPADKIIGKFSKEKKILGLSWHVDYWDYLGWKDTFASRLNTERQYSYAKALRERQVYTPQAIINGRAHAVGSRENVLRDTVNKFASSDRGMIVPINASIGGDSVSIKIDETQYADNSTLYIIYFNQSSDVKITRGENTGKTITYHNIVRKIQTLGMLKSSGLEMDFPLADIKSEDTDSAALILQASDSQGNPSFIIGAVVLSDL